MYDVTKYRVCLGDNSNCASTCTCTCIYMYICICTYTYVHACSIYMYMYMYVMRLETNYFYNLIPLPLALSSPSRPPSRPHPSTTPPHLLYIESLSDFLQTIGSSDLWERVEVDGRVVKENYLCQECVLGNVVALALFEYTRHGSIAIDLAHSTSFVPFSLPRSFSRPFSRSMLVVPRVRSEAVMLVFLLNTIFRTRHKFKFSC